MPGTTTDTVPAMLTPGEFVIKRESAKMLGLPFLRKLNAVSDNAAHGNIDALIGQAQLVNMKPMLNGGEVVPGYENGGNVEKEGLLAGLLSMLSGANKRQKAYEELVPQDMRNDERIYTIDPSYGNTDTLLEFENPIVEEIQAINRLTNADFTKDQRLNPLEKSRVDAINQLLYGIAPQPLGEQGTVAESVPLSGEEPIAGFYHPEMRFTYEDQIDRARRQYMNKQQGGLTGYKDGDIVSDDPLQIGKRMADPSIYNRSVISGQWGDERPIPEAWMQPATEPMPTAEEVAEFDRMIKMLRTQQLMDEMREKGIMGKGVSLDYEDKKRPSANRIPFNLPIPR